LVIKPLENHTAHFSDNCIGTLGLLTC